MDAAAVWTQIETDMLSGCWIWTGRVDRDGYGTARIDGKNRVVHRWVYENVTGFEIPPRMVLDHLIEGRPIAPGPCRSRRCCNPEHVEVVTVAENSRRVVAWNSRKTHCPAGHAYDEHGNVYVCADGRVRRFCRTCDRARKAAKKSLKGQVAL
jgi:hypothetical protein